MSEQEAWPGQGQYDVIICLGMTKWVQLQSGDAGVVRLFRRAYQSLLLGGLFILEPQPWSSYSRSKKASVQHLYTHLMAHIHTPVHQGGKLPHTSRPSHPSAQ